MGSDSLSTGRDTPFNPERTATDTQNQESDLIAHGHSVHPLCLQVIEPAARIIDSTGLNV